MKGSMLMSLRRVLTFTIVTSVVTMTVIVMVGVSRPIVKQQHTAVLNGPRAPLQISLSGPGNGVAVIKAQANIPARHRDRHYWWVVQFRPRLDGVGQGPEIEYMHQSFVVKAGKSLLPTFTDQFEVGPGRYNILVGIREATPHIDHNGNEKPHLYQWAVSDWVIVK
jgi:hypothetical protein